MRWFFRNLWRALRLILGGQGAEFWYELFHKWKGVEFEWVSLADLGLPPDRAHPHANSGGPTLARFFRTLDIPPGSVALDLGSGKGGAALTLSRSGFAEVWGVELSNTLVEQARQNAARLNRTNIRFIHTDAASFTDYDRVTHIFMYNPFPCAVMREVMMHLTRSLKRAPRSVTVVYRHALCHEVIMASGLFEAEAAQYPDQHTWRVYRTV
jgi:SAM-dependent methyltransferase